MLALSVNDDKAQVAAFGLPVLADDPPDFAWPLAGLEFCKQAAPHLSHVATLPADAPFAPRDFVARLNAAREASGATIAFAASLGRTHPVAGLRLVALAPALRRALAEEGVRTAEAFAARFPLAAVEWTGEPDDPFFNINAPADPARAETLIASGLQKGPLRNQGMRAYEAPAMSLDEPMSPGRGCPIRSVRALSRGGR